MSKIKRTLSVSGVTAFVLLSTFSPWPEHTYAEELSAAQFDRLIESCHDGMTDVTFVYEGEIVNHAKDEVAASRFQGLYTFRFDGATLLDLYFLPAGNDRPPSRRISAVLNGKFENMYQSDVGGYTPLSISRGGPFSLSFPPSAERFNYVSYQRAFDETDYEKFAFVGFEELEGTTCAVVDLSLYSLADNKELGDRATMIRLWVDLERSGNALKVEMRVGGKLHTRTTASDIRRFDLGEGRSFWLPMRGRAEIFASAAGGGEPPGRRPLAVSRKPQMTETYAVVDGSEVFNQAMPDSYFTAIRKDAEFSNPELKKYQIALNAAPRPVVKMDSVSVQKRLDEQLALAEQQSRMLDASKPSSRWAWAMLAPWALAVLGLSGLGLAVYWKWYRD